MQIRLTLIAPFCQRRFLANGRPSYDWAVLSAAEHVLQLFATQLPFQSIEFELLFEGIGQLLQVALEGAGTAVAARLAFDALNALTIEVHFLINSCSILFADFVD